MILDKLLFINDYRFSDKMKEICFLGTSGSVATTERDNTSFILNCDDNLVLIDCPGAVIQKIKKLDFDPRRIEAILITHIHPDHVYGLPSFVHSLMLDECQICLYGSQTTVDFCMRLLDLFHLRDKKIKCRVKFISLKPEENFDLFPSLQCTSMKVPHDPSSLGFQFILEDEGKKIIYSGDTPPFAPLFKRAADVDFLIHDCSAPSRFFQEYPSLRTMHTDSLELGRLSQEVGVKNLIPCHFFGEIDFSISEIEEEIKRNYCGNLRIPKDFTRITIK